MKLVVLMELANKCVKRISKLYPDRELVTESDRVPVQEVSEDFDRLCKWLEPNEDFDSKDIVKVCRCKNCIWYKKFRNKNGGLVKNPVIFLCKLDMKPKDPSFFCKSGEPRRTDYEKS